MAHFDPAKQPWLAKIASELGGAGQDHPLHGLSLEAATIGKFLGSGSFAAVFELEDPSSVTPLAVKVLPRQGGEEAAKDDEIFRREVEIGLALEHPSITRIYRYLERQFGRFVIMDKVSGVTLSAVERPLSKQQYRDIFGPLADGLDYAHGQGVIHRDLKPENVMLVEDGSIRILDFGMARQMGGTNVTVTGQFKGTPMYCAPEQVLDSKSVTPACDQFSFALLSFEMLTGAFPYPMDSKQPLQTLFARLQQPAARLASVRPELGEGADAVLARMLSIKPEERFSSVKEGYQALLAALP